MKLHTLGIYFIYEGKTCEKSSQVQRCEKKKKNL